MYIGYSVDEMKQRSLLLLCASKLQSSEGCKGVCASACLKRSVGSCSNRIVIHYPCPEESKPLI